MTSSSPSRSKHPVSPSSSAENSGESRGLLRFSAAAGCLIWLIHRVIADTDLIKSTLGLGVLVVLGFWASFMADYPVTRDVYFTVALAHVLAEVPFLLRTL